jgi:hypothetical protein
MGARGGFWFAAVYLWFYKHFFTASRTVGWPRTVAQFG